MFKNELIKSAEKTALDTLVTSDNDKQTVDAKALHSALGVGRDFSNWIKERIEKYGFVEGIDFSPNLAKSTGGRPSIDYALTIETAKEIATVENNDKGREIRKYLIKVEAAWNTPELIMARALQCAQNSIANYQRKIDEMTPKAAFFDAVADSRDAIPIKTLAAVLGIKGLGQNNLFKILRDKGILQSGGDSHNLPYREYIERGYFRVIETHYETADGETHIAYKTLVYQRGIDYIRKELAK
jgi:anti-repressor protein